MLIASNKQKKKICWFNIRRHLIQSVAVFSFSFIFRFHSESKKKTKNISQFLTTPLHFIHSFLPFFIVFYFFRNWIRGIIVVVRKIHTNGSVYLFSTVDLDIVNEEYFDFKDWRRSLTFIYFSFSCFPVIPVLHLPKSTECTSQKLYFVHLYIVFSCIQKSTNIFPLFCGFFRIFVIYNSFVDFSSNFDTLWDCVCWSPISIENDHLII